MKSNTSNPSSFGIWISRNSKSGFNSLAAFTVSKPLVHSATTHRSACCFKYSRISARAGASSSMIITLSCLGSSMLVRRIGRLERQTHLGGELAPLLAHIEPPCSAELRLKPLAHQRHDEAAPPRARTVRIARVAPLHDQHRMHPFCLDGDSAAFEQVRDAVQHGIFGKRLQDQRGYPGAEG